MKTFLLWGLLLGLSTLAQAQMPGLPGGVPDLSGEGQGLTPPALVPQVVGTYEATHKDWRDRLIFTPDGRYRRGNGDPGSWAYDGQRLILDWDNWGSAVLTKERDGVFFDASQRFRITRIGPAPGPAPSQPAPPNRPAPAPVTETRHFRVPAAVHPGNETLLVQYRAMPTEGGEWITLVPAGAPDDEWGFWIYTEGASGRFEIPASTFKGPGPYELRAYYGGAGDYTVRDRLRITVR